MYGLYGSNRDRLSTRYRDLVDRAIIVTHEAIDAARATEALRDEAKCRGLDLPRQLIAPSEQWQTRNR